MPRAEGSHMTDHSTSREHAVDRVHAARERRDRHFARYDAARGSPGELSAFTELQAAEEQFAARETWLACHRDSNWTNETARSKSSLQSRSSSILSIRWPRSSASQVSWRRGESSS